MARIVGSGLILLPVQTRHLMDLSVLAETPLKPNAERKKNSWASVLGLGISSILRPTAIMGVDHHCWEANSPSHFSLRWYKLSILSILHFPGLLFIPGWLNRWFRNSSTWQLCLYYLYHPVRQCWAPLIGKKKPLRLPFGMLHWEFWGVICFLQYTFLDVCFWD